MVETYGAFRFGMVAKILAESLTPSRVADILEENRQLHPEIQRSEIESYRSMGERWDYYPGSRDFITYGSLKNISVPMFEAEPVLEKRYENVRPNIDPRYPINENYFESAEGKRAMRRWAGLER